MRASGCRPVAGRPVQGEQFPVGLKEPWSTRPFKADAGTLRRRTTLLYQLEEDVKGGEIGLR